MAAPKPIYGIDISHFPGLVAMQWLRDKAKARFACFYLGPTENHPDTSWMGQRTDLAFAGWGFIPTYVGQQARVKRNGVVMPNPALNAAKGSSDGAQACDQMKSAGFAPGAVVYLDLEEGDEPTGAYQGYILAWKDAVKARSFAPAIYCPGGALRWALQYGRIVWLAAPENLDGQGKAIPVTLDPGVLPLPAVRNGPVAIQFRWEIEFDGLDQPRDGNHGPRFDLSTSLVADPSDYAAVDRALLDLKDTVGVADLDEATAAAKGAFERFIRFRDLDSAIRMATPAPASPTSDPKCGPSSNAADKIMRDNKVALNVAEAELVVDWTSNVVDTGPSEGDLGAVMASASPAAAAHDQWPEVTWPEKDADSPDYFHLASSLTLPVSDKGIATLADFELTPEDIELVLSANAMNPIGFDNVVGFAVRGARLGKLNDKTPPLEVESMASAWLTELRPDHKNFRCLIGFYERSQKADDRKITLFCASTVPNAEYVDSWFQYANPKGKAKSGIGNMMPSGCYVYRVGAHNSPHAGQIKPALRLTDSFDFHLDGTATVLRTKNDRSYGVDDVWCKTIPADNIHCSFQTVTVPHWGAPFSSAGCMTIRGLASSTDQWKKAQAIMNRLGPGKRCDVVLITGRDLAIASELRRTNASGDASVVRRELGRLRPGSQGPAVDRLQQKLGIERTSYFGSVTKKSLVDEQFRRQVPIDGIFTPSLDAAWNWQIFDPII